MWQKLTVAILALLAIALVVPLLMRASVSGFVASATKPLPHVDAIVVLGASVYRGMPSPVLAERAQKAVALYRAGVAPKILVTGDNSSLSHDEVTPVRKYLLDEGVAPQDIFLDHAGLDTYSSMYRAKVIFGANSVVIVTQDFHMPRALWLARALHLDAYGVVAQGGTAPWFGTLREIPASFKAIFDVLTHRMPQHLGPAIPLSGDGETTWY
jgi:SanA protein